VIETSYIVKISDLDGLTKGIEIGWARTEEAAQGRALRRHISVAHAVQALLTRAQLARVPAGDAAGQTSSLSFLDAMSGSQTLVSCM
jgi:hypothetical protein